MQTQELKSRTIRGLVLLILREGVIKVVAIVGQLVLVRLLLPQYFGVVAILTFVINTADLFTDLGLVSGVIRSREKPSHAVLTSLFWIKFGLTSAATLLILALAPAFKALFPGLSGGDIVALRVLSLTLLVRPIKTMMLGLLERELRYDAVPLVDIGGLVVYFIVAIAFAVSGFGVWSLVWSILVKDIVELFILEAVNPFVPSLRFSWKQAKSFMGFGAPLQGNTILGFLSQSTIPFLGGMLSNPAAVGILDWGFNIASIPRVISYNIGRISLPSFSRVQGRPELIAKGVADSTSIMGFSNLFFLAASIFFARDSIQFVVGDKWLGGGLGTPMADWGGIMSGCEHGLPASNRCPGVDCTSSKTEPSRTACPVGNGDCLL